VAVAQEKKGGPYSKDEREKRQNEVFRLHFEYGYSATKIADLMSALIVLRLMQTSSIGIPISKRS